MYGRNTCNVKSIVKVDTNCSPTPLIYTQNTKLLPAYNRLGRNMHIVTMPQARLVKNKGESRHTIPLKTIEKNRKTLHIFYQ
jgi:hypothetical protein